MKTKKIYIFILLIIIVVYLISVFCYFKYFINPQIKNTTMNIQERINSNIIELIDYLDKSDSIHDAIKNYQKNHSSSIYIEDEDGKVIYNNANIWDIKMNYYISRIINIDGTSYIIKLFEPGKWNVISAINNFVIFEFLVMFLILFIVFMSIRLKLLKPIERIQKAIKNYKFGIKPKKNHSKSELDIIENEFVDLVDSLEREKENQNLIISSISHDIRTPITSILGYSELLINSKLDSKVKKKYIDIIYQKALSLKEISDDFEDYLYENSNDLNLSMIKIIDLKERILLDYKVDLSDKHIDLIINFNDLNEYINIDINKIKRVFSNIISNSVRYINNNGKIIIDGKKIKDYYQFEISDNGTGTKEDLNKIFEPLFTTDKSRKISGLGLSICKEIIIKHGGSITAYNNDLGGLTIRFTIKNNNI